MKSSAFIFAGVLAFAAMGCAVDASDSSGSESQDEIIAFPTATSAQAIDAFLRDPNVNTQLAGHQYAAPKAIVSGLGSIGESKEFLVATYFDATPDGVKDASFSRTVSAKVRFANGPAKPPTITLADIKRTGETGWSTVSGDASDGIAIQAFLADPKVKEAFGSHAPRTPEAILVSRGSTFGMTVDEYLVVSHVDLSSGGPALPEGVPVGGVVPFFKRVAASVVFPPVGGSPSVSLVTFEDAK